MVSGFFILAHTSRDVSTIFTTLIVIKKLASDSKNYLRGNQTYSISLSSPYSTLSPINQEIPQAILLAGFLSVWYLQDSNRGHMDFQSIALPPELRHHHFCDLRLQSYGKFLR